LTNTRVKTVDITAKMYKLKQKLKVLNTIPAMIPNFFVFHHLDVGLNKIFKDSFWQKGLKYRFFLGTSHSLRR